MRIKSKCQWMKASGGNQNDSAVKGTRGFHGL